jgi:predicted methyltransferase
LTALAVSLIQAPVLASRDGDGIGAGNTTRLKAAIAGNHREAKNRTRDVYRHPLGTLSFFGLKPERTVVEIYPGGGWYTEILAPYLKGHGRLYTASWNKDSKRKTIQKWLKRYNRCHRCADRPIHLAWGTSLYQVGQRT